MIRKLALAVMLYALMMLPATALADGFTETIVESGSNVVVTGSGKINLSGLSFFINENVGFNINPSIGLIKTAGGNADSYTGISGPASFGSGGNSFYNTASGSVVGIEGASDTLFVPGGYASETSLSGTSTYDNATFSSLGLTPGTYVWTWGSGTDQKFTLNVQSSAAPEPSSLLLLGTGLIGGIAAMRRKLPA